MYELVLIKYRPVFPFSDYSYIIRNAKKWCTSKIALREDASITAYVVSYLDISFTVRLSARSGTDVERLLPSLTP